MKTVQCKKLGSVMSLTVGKVYEIIEENDNRFTIVNDNGVQMRYGKTLFRDPVEVVEEVAEAPRRGRGRPRAAAIGEGGRILAPEPAQIPAPIRIPVVDQIEVNTAATNEDGVVSFTIRFTFLPDRELLYSTGNIISTNGISASCGIQSLSGVDELVSTLGTIRERFTTYLRDNRQHFTLSQDIDVNNLFQEIAVALVQDLVATFQGDDADIKAGILILSTTVGAIGRQPSLRRALDEAAVQSIPVNNPNSGNNIIMWNIAVEA